MSLSPCFIFQKNQMLAPFFVHRIISSHLILFISSILYLASSYLIIFSPIHRSSLIHLSDYTLVTQTILKMATGNETSSSATMKNFPAFFIGVNGSSKPATTSTEMKITWIKGGCANIQSLFCHSSCWICFINSSVARQTWPSFWRLELCRPKGFIWQNGIQDVSTKTLQPRWQNEVNKVMRASANSSHFWESKTLIAGDGVVAAGFGAG